MALERLTPRQPFSVIAMSTLVPVERLWMLFAYNPLTGQLFSRKLGRPLSTKERKQGHEYSRVNIAVNGKCYCYSTQSVVWAWCTGTWPPKGFTVDHKDRNRSNNRIHNLRLATSRDQAQNTNSFKGGVKKTKAGTYQSRIWIDGKHIHLGMFATKAEAQAAYARAASELP